jgi:hypothetical protein
MTGVATSHVPLRVLAIADSEDDCAILLRALDRGGYVVTSRRVSSEPQLASLLDEPWDVILIDWPYPSWGGDGALAYVAAQFPDVPCIVISRVNDAEVAVGVLRSASELGRRLKNMRMYGLQHDVELPVARILAELEETGVCIDVAHLRGLGGKVEAQIASLEAKVRAIAGDEINLGSPKQVATLLFEKLDLAGASDKMKKTKTGFSVDADSFLEIKSEAKKKIQGQEVEGEQTFGNYQEVNGLLFPFAMEMKAKGAPSGQTITIEKVEINPAVTDDLFQMPKAAAAAVQQ